MNVSLTYKYTTVHPWWKEKHIGAPGTTYNCKLLCGCWELNWGSLKEQQVFLTTGPSL